MAENLSLSPLKTAALLLQYHYAWPGLKVGHCVAVWDCVVIGVLGPGYARHNNTTDCNNTTTPSPSPPRDEILYKMYSTDISYVVMVSVTDRSETTANKWLQYQFIINLIPEYSVVAER